MKILVCDELVDRFSQLSFLFNLETNEGALVVSLPSLKIRPE